MKNRLTSLLLVLLALSTGMLVAAPRLESGGAAKPEARPGIWAHDAGKIRMEAAGPDVWRLVHTGSADWAYNPYPKFAVKPGEVYRFEGTLGTAPGTGGTGWANLCAALFDKDGKPVEWMWGATGLKRGAAQTIRYMIPQGVAFMHPRIVGAGGFDGVLKDLRLTAEKPVSMKPPCLATDVGRAVSMKPPCLESDVLKVTFDGLAGVLAVTDKRTGRTWQTAPVAGSRLMATHYAQRINGFGVVLLDPQSMKEYQATYTLDRTRPELVVEVTGEGEMRRPFAYPAPLVTRPGDRFIFPHNEGVGFPVEEKHPVGERYAAWNGSGLCMAFFGTVEDATGAGWMTILETEADASMRTSRGADGCLTGGPQWDPQLGRFGYTRKARYVFFDKGGYVAMCKRYRARAKEIGRWKPFSEKVKERPILDRLFGAINIWCWEPHKEKWIADLQNAGIRRILWSGGGNASEIAHLAANPEVLVGRYDVYTDVYRPEQLRKLGWKSGSNTEAWPKDVIWNGPSSNEWTRAWGVKAKDGTWTYCATLCDMCSPDYCRRNIAKDLETKPYNARFLDVTTAGTWKECWNPRHPMNRIESRRARERLLAVVSKEFGLVTGGETGHDFSVPFCDYYEGMLSLCSYRVPDSGRYIQHVWTNAPERVVKYQVGEKYRLPLWELVYHDCTCAEWYWGDYNNKLPQLWAKRDLFNVLYGTMGMFMFNARQWKEDKERFVRSYRITSPVARATAKSEMLDHFSLTPDRSVQRSVFANGVTVTVNFGDNPWRDADGTVLPARSHRVTGLPRE